MRHRLCLRMAHPICLGASVIALWGCAAQPSPAGHAGRRTIADLLQPHAPGPPPTSAETPTDADWQLWTTIKARWPEVEQMLADRQAVLSTPLGPPGHTQKKPYVFDVWHVLLIDRYARDHRLDLNAVLYQALEEFF
jgi:hypothetical protein